MSYDAIATCTGLIIMQKRWPSAKLEVEVEVDLNMTSYKFITTHHSHIIQNIWQLTVHDHLYECRILKLQYYNGDLILQFNNI